MKPKINYYYASIQKFSKNYRVLLEFTSKVNAQLEFGFADYFSIIFEA
jgi:hypothetical protein